MVSVVMDPGDEVEVASALQRFLSAIAFRYAQPVEDVHHGATGDSDPFNGAGTRVLRSFAATQVVDAPIEVVVVQDEALWRALAFNREGVNAASPIYKCLCFWNVLDAAFDVLRGETPQAHARDEFVNERCIPFVEWHHLQTPVGDWATYFRDEIRNAAAHVLRPAGKRVLNPDAGQERVQLNRDAAVLANLASEAIGERWPSPVAIRRDDEEWHLD
jgi:hypothetical protein